MFAFCYYFYHFVFFGLSVEYVEGGRGVGALKVSRVLFSFRS